MDVERPKRWPGSAGTISFGMSGSLGSSEFLQDQASTKTLS